MSFSSTKGTGSEVQTLQWKLGAIHKLSLNNTTTTILLDQNPLDEVIEPAIQQYSGGAYKEDDKADTTVRDDIRGALDMTLVGISQNANTHGRDHVILTIDQLKALLADGDVSRQALGASLSGMVFSAEGTRTTTSLFKGGRCLASKHKCFLQARARLSHLGGSLLRSLFAYACQDKEFLDNHVTMTNQNDTERFGMWRIVLHLNNAKEVAEALDASTGDTTKYYTEQFKKLDLSGNDANDAKWVFIVTAHRTGPATRLYISFVDDASIEYDAYVDPLFSPIDLSRPLLSRRLRPSKDASLYVGGTPFVVPPKQAFLGAASLAGYQKLAPRPRLSVTTRDAIWAAGSKTLRTAAMRHWVALVAQAGFHDFDELKHLSAERIYARLHPIITTATGECRYPLSQNTLRVLGLAQGMDPGLLHGTEGYNSYQDTTANKRPSSVPAMTTEVLRDLLGYFVNPDGKAAAYFFEIEGRSSSTTKLVNPSRIQFTNVLLVDIMVATVIYQQAADFKFAKVGAGENISRALGGQENEVFEPETLIRAYAATFSPPHIDVDVTVQEEVASIINMYDEHVLAPVAGYVGSVLADVTLRQQLDHLRATLLRLGFVDRPANSRGNAASQAQFELLISAPIVSGKKRNFDEAELDDSKGGDVPEYVEVLEPDAHIKEIENKAKEASGSEEVSPKTNDMILAYILQHMFGDWYNEKRRQPPEKAFPGKIDVSTKSYVEALKTEIERIFGPEHKVIYPDITRMFDGISYCIGLKNVATKNKTDVISKEDAENTKALAIQNIEAVITGIQSLIKGATPYNRDKPSVTFLEQRSRDLLNSLVRNYVTMELKKPDNFKTDNYLRVFYNIDEFIRQQIPTRSERFISQYFWKLGFFEGKRKYIGPGDRSFNVRYVGND